MTNVCVTRFQLKFFRMIINVTIYYFLKILGLAPFSVRTKNSCKNSIPNCTMVFSFSKIGLAYSTLLVVLLPAMAVLLLPRLLSLDYKHESLVAQATDVSQGILCLLTLWIIITNWTLNQRKATHIMNRIFEIDARLPCGDKQKIKKPKIVIATTHVILNVSVWVIVLVSESVKALISDAIVNWFFFTIPSFVIYCFVVEYLVVVRLVAGKLKTVNKSLSNFNQFCNYSSRTNFLNEHLTGWGLSVHRQLDALNLLHNIRTEICDVSQDISEFFSFPILACIAYSFFSLVYNVYFITTIAVFENDDLPIADATMTGLWIIISIYPLGLLFFNITEIVTEAKLTGRLVHKLLSTAVREEIKAELAVFSLQLLHENFDFTAYGFFTLNFTLLHSMLGATATYLVILIQFQ